MIYLDTSVALAHLLAEDRQPPRTLWAQPLVSSPLLEYELWSSTLDALHLASADFLRQQRQTIEIASYDDRFLSAARHMGFGVSPYCPPS